jgi:hypothetical protein
MALLHCFSTALPNVIADANHMPMDITCQAKQPDEPNLAALQPCGANEIR